MKNAAPAGMFKKVMINYDFRNLLSSFEFECFSRDLINAHEGLDLMSFAVMAGGQVNGISNLIPQNFQFQSIEQLNQDIRNAT